MVLGRVFFYRFRCEVYDRRRLVDVFYFLDIGMGLGASTGLGFVFRNVEIKLFFCFGVVEVGGL